MALTQSKEVGALINERYRVVSHLGQGGMGSVYLVEDLLEGGVKRALKTLRLEKMSESVVELFKGEFQLLTQLHHPNLAQVFDFGSTPPSPSAPPELFFTIEFISGIDLFKATHTRNLEDIYDFAVQMCRALEYMGSRGIVHGDLKPANILVENKALHIVDFGIAPEFYKKSNPGLFGTPKYMAPELIRGDRVDRRSDLYSLGVILYFLVARKAPFEAKTPEEYFKKHLNAVPVDLIEMVPHIPKEFSRMVMRLLAKDPADRYFRASQVIEAINKVAKNRFALETIETRQGYVLSGKLIGREQDMQQLKDFEKNLFLEKPEKIVCVVSAERGGGKSRLIKEWKSTLQVNGVPVFSADLKSVTQQAFYPFARIIEQVLGEFHPGRRRVLTEKYPILFQVLFGEGMESKEAKEASPVPEGARAFRIYEEISQFFAEVSHLFKAQSRQGLVLIFDPIENLTQQDLEVVLHMTREFQQLSQPSPVLLLFSKIHQAGSDAPYSDEKTLYQKNVPMEHSQSKTQHHALESLLNDEKTLHIALNNLSLEETQLLVESMVGERVGGERFIRDLEAFTNGNPLMIQEVLRSLAEQGVLSTQEDVRLEYLSVDLEKLQVPKTIETVVKERLAKLSQPEREILEAIAVFRQPLALEKLQKVFPEKSTKTIFQCLMSLRAKGDLEVAGLGEEVFYQIAHGGLRKTVYEGLEARYRQSMHLRFAHVLEQHDLAGGQREELLAHHYLHAGENEEARKYILAAAKGATRKMAHDIAIEWYQAALRLFDESGGAFSEERRWVYMEVARLYRLTGDYQASIETLEQLRTRTAAVAVGTAKVEMLRDLSYSHLLLGQFGEALTFIDQAIEASIKPDPHLDLNLRWIRGRILLKHSRFDEVLKEAKAGLEQCKARAFEQERAEFLYNRGMAFYLQEKPVKASEDFRKSLQIFEKHDLHQRAMLAANALGMVAFSESQWSKAVKFFEKSLATATTLGDSVQMLVCISNLGACLHRQGKFAQAMEFYQQGLGVSEKSHDDNFLLLLLINLGNLYAETYHLEKSFELFLRALQLARVLKQDSKEILCLKYLGEICRAQEDWGQSEGFFVQCLKKSQLNHAEVDQVVSLQGLAQIKIRQSDWEKAGAYFKEAEKRVSLLPHLGVQRDQAILKAKYAVRRFLERKDMKVEVVNEALKGALNLTRGAGNERALWEVLFVQGQFFLAQKKIDLAKTKLQEAFIAADQFAKTLPEEFRSFFQASAQFRDLKQLIERLKTPSGGKSSTVEATLLHLQGLEKEKALLPLPEMQKFLQAFTRLKQVSADAAEPWFVDVLGALVRVTQAQSAVVVSEQGEGLVVRGGFSKTEDFPTPSAADFAWVKESQVGFVSLRSAERLYALCFQGRFLGCLCITGIADDPKRLSGLNMQVGLFCDLLAMGLIAFQPIK